MNASSFHRFPIRGSDIVATLLIALGASVIGGWLVDHPITIVVGLDRIGMTFNAALCFIVAGLALSLERPSMRLLLALLLAIPSVLTLCEYAFDIDLFIDDLFGGS